MGRWYMDTLVLVDEQKLTSTGFADTECHLEDILRAMTDRDEWQEGQWNACY